MYFRSKDVPTDREIRSAVYASVFGPLGFFGAASISNYIGGVTSHSPPLFQAAWTFLMIWALGIIPSMGITLIVGIPYYALLKLLGAHNPILVAVSGAPVMWLITAFFPESGYRILFICASGLVSLVFGILLWLNSRRNEFSNT